VTVERIALLGALGVDEAASARPISAIGVD